MTLVDADTGEVVVVAPDSLTFSEDNYGRDSVDKSTVDDYAEALRAGAEFPPIEVYADGEIAGGVHRWHAHSAVGLDVRAVVVECPESMSRRVFSASLNVRNGKRQTRKELERIAIDEARMNPDLSQVDLAEALGVSRSTVQRWVAPVTQAADRVRKLKAALLLDAGWTQRKVGAEIGVAQQTLADWVPDLPKWADSVTADIDHAVAQLSDPAQQAVGPIVDEWREAEKLRQQDKREAERLRMAIGGWPQLRKFRDNPRREEVLALLSDADQQVIAEMEDRIHG